MATDVTAWGTNGLEETRPAITRVFQDILRCPLHPDEGRLEIEMLDEEVNCSGASIRALRCSFCGRSYPFNHGIVDMLGSSPRNEYLQRETLQWDRHASGYDRKRLHDATYMNCVRAGLGAVRPRPGDLILDAGCGTGIGTRRLHHFGIRTVALDLSLTSLAYLSQQMSIPGIAYVRADMRQLPVATNTLDRLISANALQHVPDRDSRSNCIEEFARAVRPGGTVVVTVHGYSFSKRRAGWAKEGPSRSSSGDVQYIYRFEVGEFRRILSGHLRVISITGAGLPLPYRFKLSPLSFLLEKIFSRFGWNAPWGHMLVAKCAVD
jgi:SAM-dependent methyltransferase